MKKRIIAIVMALSLLLAVMAPVASAGASRKDTVLQFHQDGNFKIMMISDTQDTDKADQRMIHFIEASLDQEKPDLVVFTGDNIAGRWVGSTVEKVRTAIDKIIQPLVQRDIPFAVVFGNHDGESRVTTKEDQMAMFMAYDNCLAIDESEALDGVGTYNLPILSSDGSRVAFNIYMMDSNDYDANGNYDGVHQNQIDWYEQTSNTLKAENGGDPVPSLLFQHIPVPQIYSLLKQVPFGVMGSVRGSGRNSTKWYVMDESKAEGVVKEGPCPSYDDHGQYDSWLRQGDIAGAFFGHDHTNNMVGKTDEGITLGYNAGCSFHLYGDGLNRSMRMFVIDENDAWNYDTYLVKYGDIMPDDGGCLLVDLIAVRTIDNALLYGYQLIKQLFGGSTGSPETEPSTAVSDTEPEGAPDTGPAGSSATAQAGTGSTEPSDTPATERSELSNGSAENPATGVSLAIPVLALVSASAAVAFVLTRKKAK